ncbi:MAG: hypothetical protein WB402_13550 [Sulfuricaulis sp.]|uniref:hypothetical protein n=1 Tax=Sulfuricaulis sp. TaxID=2003553 RepID=UPI003C4D2D03
MMVLVVLLGWFLGFAGLALHLYTVLVDYEGFGFWSAFLAFLFPVLAQIYYSYKTIAVTGLFLNFYTFWVGLYLLGWLAWIMSAIIAGRRHG